MKDRRVTHVAELYAPPLPPLGEVLEFMRLLWAVAQGLSATSKGLEASLGVTDLQRLVLRLTRDSPGITATRLAGVLHTHPSTLTGVVKRLVKRGYLRREEDPYDLRCFRLFVTDAGRALEVPSLSEGEVAIQRLLLRMPGEVLMEARELLTELAGELHRAEGPLPSHEPAEPRLD